MKLLRWVHVMMLVGCFLLSSGAMSLAAPASDGCPAPEKVQENARKVLRNNIDVLKISPTTLSGVCEVQISMGGQKRLFYTDSEGKFFLLGQLIEAQSGQNLTRESMEKLMRLSPEEMKQLDSLVAFSAGTGEKVIYFVTDPQCPYCKKGEETLKKLVDSGEITMKVLFFPLDFHKGAKEQCIAIICDNKSLEDFDSGYKSENQCPEGTKKVNDTTEFMKNKGINGTPAYIFPDGQYHMGMMPEQAVRERLGLPQAKVETSAKDNATAAQPAKDNQTVEQPAKDNGTAAEQPAKEAPAPEEQPKKAQ